MNNNEGNNTMNTETEELDFDQHAAEARARMRKVLAGLERANEEQPTPQLATAIIKAQERLDHYCGFEGAPRMRTPEDDKSLVDIVNDVCNF